MPLVRVRSPARQSHRRSGTREGVDTQAKSTASSAAAPASLKSPHLSNFGLSLDRIGRRVTPHQLNTYKA